MTENNRYCEADELWLCPHCGRHVDYDRYDFDDESCMLNAVKAKRTDCTYQDDDVNKRIIAVGVAPDVK